ncbi:MAG: hypothetical protein U9O87_09995 [Verrucomicrobiota bacterium]|nr:hypothetical protein [Verrucomicrobiota bacterium]
MLEVMKRMMTVGLGAANMTKEKLSELSEELVEKGKLTEEEGKKLYKQLQEESDKAKKTFDKKIEYIVNKSLEKVPCKRIWNDVDKRLQRIEEKLDIDKKN